MLVLSRFKGEKVIITVPAVLVGTTVVPERKIVVGIADIQGPKVRLMVGADPDVSIHREEVQARIDNKG